MTEVGSVYGQSLYELCAEEGLCETVYQQLGVLQESFSREPGFLQLLSSPSLPKTQRCQILDDSFRDQLHPYVLNFLKILTERGYLRHFDDCCRSYESRYDADNGILPVTAYTAVAMTDSQKQLLLQKLGQMTGKKIKLKSRIDPSILGGVRLDYDGQRLDDTVLHRLDAVRKLLSKTVL